MDEEGRLSPMTVQVGDKVLFSSYAGTEVNLGEITGEDYLILVRFLVYLEWLLLGLCYSR